MAKSIAAAYFLWFFLGTFGIHQFYLRRDRHAFFTWATLGGLFWIGWLRDLFYIPKYVADVNEDPEHMRVVLESMHENRRPRISASRFVATALVGYLFGALVYLALWREDLDPVLYGCLAVLAHLAIALGVYSVMNEGRCLVEFQWCALGSIIILPCTVYYIHYFVWGDLTATFLAAKKVRWRQTLRTHGFCYRIAVLTMCGILYLGLWGSAIYFNATITTAEGESVPVREAIHNFFKSPAWKETKDTFRQVYQYYRVHGWKHLWQQILEMLDPKGEANAYLVLGLNKSATQEDIKSQYKLLARQWHPDKVKDVEKKREAEAKFMEIQEAYDLLSNLKQGRTKKNQKTVRSQ